MSFLGKNAFGIPESAAQTQGAFAPGAGPDNSSISPLQSPPSPPLTPGGGGVASLLAQKNTYTDSQVASG